jgi:hypothetical protein
MIREIINNYIINNQVLILILSIFACVLFAIIIIRITLNFLINQAYQKYKALKNILPKNILPKTNKFLKEDEELFRHKNKIPKSNSQIKAEIRNAQKDENEPLYEIIQRPKEQDLEQVEIVDIIKPIGFWTSMILGQKLTYLIQSAQMLNKKDSKGFWVSMVEAKDRVAGKQHSRGR